MDKIFSANLIMKSSNIDIFIKTIYEDYP